MAFTIMRDGSVINTQTGRIIKPPGTHKPSGGKTLEPPIKSPDAGGGRRPSEEQDKPKKKKNEIDWSKTLGKAADVAGQGAAWSEGYGAVSGGGIAKGAPSSVGPADELEGYQANVQKILDRNPYTTDQNVVVSTTGGDIDYRTKKKKIDSKYS